VDIIGLSVFGLQAYDRLTVGRDRSFDDIFGPRYQRAARFNKPVVVAELGYSGTADYVAAWEGDVRRVRPEYPMLVGVVYFNQEEVYPWPDDLGFPDWRIDHRIVNGDR
jgi:endoglucanase